jgi:predicted nucleotidyltransferase
MATPELETLLKELVAWARAQDGIIALYLHGSHAQGGAGPLSDVDVAVLARPELSRSQMWRLEDRCAARWPEVVDVRVLNLAPLSFCYEVTSRGRRLWAADAGAVADWESLVWRRYWDLRPLLERDWGQYVKAVMEQRGETERQQYQTTLEKVRAVHRRVREAAAGYSPDAQD